MKTLKLSTNLINGIFSGTYGTIWDCNDSPDFYGFYKMGDILQGYQDNKDVILQGLQKVINGIMGIEFPDSYSPKEYNFSNDTLDIDLKVSNKFLPGLVDKLKNDEDFHQYLKDHFTSCDGFMSFTPNNIKDWINEIENESSEFEQSIGAGLSYLLHPSDFDLYDSIEYEMYELLSDYRTYTCVECDSENVTFTDYGMICNDCKHKMIE